MMSGRGAYATKKRSSARNSLEKKILILLESRLGCMSVGMFKCNTQIKKENAVIWPERDTNTEKDVIDLKPAVMEAYFPGVKVDLKLQPVRTFYKQNPYQPIGTFASCRFPGMPEELYIFPDDCTTSIREFSPPYVLNLITNKMDELPIPKTSKWQPIAAAVGDYVYVLSTGSVEESPDPRFESYDPAQKIWEPAPDPPFLGWEKPITGYVVLKDKFIVVCLTCFSMEDESTFYSYNTETGLWKPVKQLPSETDAKVYPALFGEGAVLFDGDDVACGDGVIYSYHSHSLQLLAFSYSEETEESEDSIDYDLTFGTVSVVKGFHIERIISYSADGRPLDYESGAIVEVDHNVFCLLHADRHFAADPAMIVSGLIIKIHDDDFASCTVLKEFTSALALGKVLHMAKVKSCLLLEPEEQRGVRPWKGKQKVDHPWKHKQTDDRPGKCMKRNDRLWKRKQRDNRKRKQRDDRKRKQQDDCPLKHKRWTT